MCTVTYLPLPQGDFIITSNRDESRLRPTLPPTLHTVHGKKIYFPKDSLAGGTWFATSAEYTLVLLNGAETKHERILPYRKSRGLVMLDFFKYNSPHRYAEEYDFEGIEPFTLVLAATKGGLVQLRWNEKEVQVEEKDDAHPAIWSSATLYDEPTRLMRARWFDEWLKTGNDFTVQDILRFHRFGGTGDMHNDLVMNREDRVQTVSITSFEKRNGNNVLWYSDLVNEQLHSIDI